jgi:hypothetical protein
LFATVAPASDRFWYLFTHFLAFRSAFCSSVIPCVMCGRSYARHRRARDIRRAAERTGRAPHEPASSG